MQSRSTASRRVILLPLEGTPAIVRDHVARVFQLPDAPIFEAQRVLVREGGWVVEPAGAAAFALARVSPDLLEGAKRVAVVVSV